MPISTPSQITVPFATSGLKNAIPSISNPVTGNAGYDAGFPATNMTPKEAGGIPPFGQDFNGILFDITTAIRYLEAGMQFPYSSTFATAVGGYPLGAIVTRTDGLGFWRNTVANNTADPEGAGTGWQPEGSGSASITMTSSNVTLTNLQSANDIIIVSGLLTANLQLIFPAYVKQWLVINNTTGSFSITCKTASGSGVTAAQSVSTLIYGNGTSIGASAQTGFDFLNTQRVTIASSSTINLTIACPNSRNIAITGITTITGFTVAAGQLYFVTFLGALTLINSATLVTQSGVNITTTPGDTCILRATAANTVEILCYTRGIPQAIGYGQTTQDMVGKRVFATSYTNTTGRPILLSVYAVPVPANILNLFVNGAVVAQNTVNNATSGANSTLTWIILPGQAYQVSSDHAALAMWTEITV